MSEITLVMYQSTTATCVVDLMDIDYDIPSWVIEKAEKFGDDLAQVRVFQLWNNDGEWLSDEIEYWE
jgi:hypothetical protein